MITQAARYPLSKLAPLKISHHSSDHSAADTRPLVRASPPRCAPQRPLPPAVRSYSVWDSGATHCTPRQKIWLQVGRSTPLLVGRGCKRLAVEHHTECAAAHHLCCAEHQRQQSDRQPKNQRSLPLVCEARRQQRGMPRQKRLISSTGERSKPQSLQCF